MSMPPLPPDDRRRHAPATLRNREPIREVLARVLPEEGTVLEVAAGTGEHAAYLAPLLVPRVWLPSDPDPDLRASIEAWRQAEPSPGLLAPIALDVTTSPWPVERDPPDPPIAAIVAVNLIHIAPWAACQGLLAGAGRVLPPSGVLYLYGPFRIGGATAPSNTAFDGSLRARDPAWGVRDLEAVALAAAPHGLRLAETVAMPANNLSVVLVRA
jgi:SAM-dependent methyltransferase